MPARFDWYQGTFFDHDQDEVVRFLERKFDLADLNLCKPKNGYERGVEFLRAGDRLAQVWWAGNPGVHVIATGERSPAAAEYMRELGLHRVTRLDSCVDFICPGLFDVLSDGLLAYASEHDILINMQGDWERGKARTLYLGSRQSAVQLVVYEKGYEAGGDLNWVRVEARVRPKGRENGERVSTWTPEDAFQASRWLCGALEAQGWASLTPKSIGTVWKPSDDQRARRTMLKQYGAILARWAEETGGWSQLGPSMSDTLQEMGLERRLLSGDTGAVNDYLDLLARREGEPA